MFIIALIPLVLILICAKKESKVTSVYMHYNVYTRFTAYITISLILAGISSMLGGLLAILIFGSEGVFKTILMVVWCLGLGLVISGIGVRLYKGIAKNCPAPLKKKLFKSMVITAFGVGIKICVFFLGFVWTLVQPKEVVGPNGETLYVFNGEVYDKDGNPVGTLTGNNTFKPNRNYRR